MKRKAILFINLLILLSVSYVAAQDIDDPNHENHYKQVDPIETDQYKIEISDDPSGSHAKFLSMDSSLLLITSFNLFAFAGTGPAYADAHTKEDCEKKQGYEWDEDAKKCVRESPGG